MKAVVEFEVEMISGPAEVEEYKSDMEASNEVMLRWLDRLSANSAFSKIVTE